MYFLNSLRTGAPTYYETYYERKKKYRPYAWQCIDFSWMSMWYVDMPKSLYHIQVE